MTDSSAKKVKRVKPAKPDRNHRYSIEIAENCVRVIKTSASGIITGAASAEVEGLPEAYGKEYAKVLSKAIAKASRAAKVPRGFGLPCAVVVGGPSIVIRRFTWPEMTAAALQVNAVQEISPYLPEGAEMFTVNHRVLRVVPKTETTATTMDLMVAAIPTDMANAIVSAVSKAGYYTSHLDVYENARGKLGLVCRGSMNILRPTDETVDEIADGFDSDIKPSPMEITPTSYAVLDINNPKINISLYLDGVFFSNRYFSARESADSPYETDALANEISSIIDYIQYRERGSSIQCIMLLGDEEKLPGITQSLKDNLDIPIFSTGEWFKENMFHEKVRKSTDIFTYLDAYGAALPASAGMDIKHFNHPDLNIIPAKKPNPAARVLIPVGCTLVVLAGLIFAGVMIPLATLSDLKAEEAKLDGELENINITQADYDRLSMEIESMSGKMGAKELFFKEYPQADVVIPLIFALETDETGKHIIHDLDVSTEGIELAGETNDLNQLADSVDKLRTHEEFADINVETADSGLSGDGEGFLSDESVVDYNVNAQLRRGEATQ